MQTYIALFRGINVGGNNLMPMKRLRSLLESHGYQNVKTYIQSGNVVFNSKNASADKVAELVSNEFGFSPNVMLVSSGELNAVLSECPYLTMNAQLSKGSVVHFYFCESAAELSVENSDKLNSLCAGDEQFTLKNSVLYLYAPNGIGRSKLAANVESCLQVSATTRNLNTINALVKIAEASIS